MSDIKHRLRRYGAGTIAADRESRRLGAVGERKVRKRRGKNGSAASAAPENPEPSLLQPEVMPTAKPVEIKPRLREQALPEKHDHRFFDRWMLDRARRLGERAVKVEALEKLAEAGRRFAKWRNLRHPVAAERESAADHQTVVSTPSRIARAKNEATRRDARAKAEDDKAAGCDREADGIKATRLTLRPALRGARIDPPLAVLASLVVFGFDLVVLHLVLGETPGSPLEHWVTAAMMGCGAVLAGEVLGWIAAAGTIEADGSFHRPSWLVAVVMAALSILTVAFFADLGAFRSEALQRIGLEDGLRIPDPSFFTLGQVICFVASAALCFSYIARGRGRELHRERMEKQAQAGAHRNEAVSLRQDAERARTEADEAPVLRDQAKARIRSRADVAKADGKLDLQQGEYLDPLLDSEYKEARADTEVGILYWTILERARASFARSPLRPSRAAVAAVLTGGAVFLLAGSLVAAGIAAVAVGAGLLLTGQGGGRDGRVVESEQARAFRADVEPLVTDLGRERASDITRLVPFESNGHHRPIDPDDLREVVDNE